MNLVCPSLVQSRRGIKKTGLSRPLSFLTSHATRSVFLNPQAACMDVLRPPLYEGVQRRGSGSLWRGSSPLSRLEQHPREVEEGAECSDLCREAHDADDQPDESSPRRTGFLHPVLQSDGVALDRPLPAEGFFLAPPPASPRVLFLTLCFLNAAPRL